MRVGVALGSNLGDRLQNLRAAREAIIGLKSVTAPVQSSAVYETEPINCEPGAPQFLNAVLEFEYDGDAPDLLRRLQGIEARLGRPQHHERNISRNVDIDLLYVGNTAASNEDLRLPHPRMHLRRFVLQPLSDIRPDLVLPNQTKTVSELLASLDQSGKVERKTNEW